MRGGDKGNSSNAQGITIWRYFKGKTSQLNMTWKRDDSPVNTSKQDSKRAPPARIAIDRAFYNFSLMLLIWSKLEYNKS